MQDWCSTHNEHPRYVAVMSRVMGLEGHVCRFMYFFAPSGCMHLAPTPRGSVCKVPNGGRVQNRFLCRSKWPDPLSFIPIVFFFCK